MSEPMTYEPETWTVRKDDVYAAIEALQNGIEYASECLRVHDINLGRTTLRNRTWADRIEADKRGMCSVLADLRGYGPDTTPTP